MQTVHLQGIGEHPAVPAAEAKPGGHIVYNYGGAYEILSVTVGPKWVFFTLRSPEGNEYSVKKKPGTLIGYRE